MAGPVRNKPATIFSASFRPVGLPERRGHVRREPRRHPPQHHHRGLQALVEGLPQQVLSLSTSRDTFHFLATVSLSTSRDTFHFFTTVSRPASV